MKQFNRTQNIALKANTKNFANGTKIKVSLTPYDNDKKSFGKIKKTHAEVKDNVAKYIFSVKGLAKELSLDLNKICYIGAWIDSDNDGKVDSNEEIMLEIVEAEEKITIIVELPHSKETGVSAKGLAGHTAMAIGERFFDYGPDYDHSKQFNEKQYQADLNQDGDMNDIVTTKDIPNLDYYFAPGRPWWGEMISNNPKSVMLSQAINFILPNWRTNNIYGTVYKIEFYVKKSESDKMIKWWEDRYKHLKVYSVKPWTGDQCTTAVKQALAFGGINDIDWDTQTPKGILEDLKTEIKSTSIQHKNEKAKVTLIKKEAWDWEP